MPLKTIVKVSNISNLSDARYCAGMGVDMLGFRVIPGGDDFMSREVFQDIRGWISGPKIVAELYGLTDPEQISTVVQTYAPDYFELDAEAYAKYGGFLELPALVYFQRVEDIKALVPHKEVIYLLLDEDVACKDLGPQSPPVLKKVTSLKALQGSLDENCFQGVVLEAPKQSRPGITNYEQLGTILEALDEE